MMAWNNRNRLPLLRPRFSLWAMLVVITVVAIPLAYVAQRRSWNLRRLAAYELLTEKRFEFEETWPVTNAHLGSPADDPFGPTKSSNWTFQGCWNDLCLENSAPRIKEFYAFTSYHHGLIEKDEDVAGLAAFPEIEGITLASSPGLTDQGLGTLQGLGNLRYLSLRSLPKLNGEFFRHLMVAKQLETLRLSYLPQLDGKLICQLRNFQNLKDLELEWCELATDDSLRHIDLPPSLKKLTIESHSIGDETLLRWLSQVQLTELKLRAPVTRKLATALARQHALESLDLLDAPFVDEDLSFLEKCSKLKILKLEVMPIRGDFLHRLPEPERLEELSLSSTLLSDGNLAAISRCKNLSGLDLEWIPITGEGFGGAVDWPKAVFSLLGTRLSERGKSALATIRGPGHVVLPANWTELDPHSFPSVQRPFGTKTPEGESGIVGGPYPWNSLLWKHLPRHCSADELAPVLRLHAMMREQLNQEIGNQEEP